jgi:hypothetical protein
MLLTVATAYLYDRYDGKTWRLFALSVVLSLLAATHYLNFAAAAGALVVDYVIRGTSRPKLSLGRWAILIIPTALALTILILVYNPLDRHALPSEQSRGFALDKVTLLRRSIRDMNRCEYGVLCIMASAPLVALVRRQSGLARLFAACSALLFVTVLLSPQQFVEVGDADVRYLAPLVVPCIALTVLTLTTAAGRKHAWVAPLIAIIVSSNVLHQPWDRTVWQSTIAEYVHELRFPRRPASELTAAWLTANVSPDRWAAIIPTDWLSPLIVAAPHLRYGWQFDARQKFERTDLPDEMFAGLAPVDVLVVGGLVDTAKKVREEVLPALAAQGWNYKPAATLDVFFDDRTRPELIWHWFRDRPYDRPKHGIYIYRLTP